MKKSLIPVFLFAMTQIGFGQTVFENFDNFNLQNKYIVATPQVTPNSKITLFRQPVDNYENDNALGLEYSIPAMLDGCGEGMVELVNLDTNNGVWNFSDYQSLSFAINNKIKCSKPSQVYLSIILFDVSDAPPNTKNMVNAEYWVSFQYVLDLDTGWNTYDVPFIEVSKLLLEEKPSSGFWHSDQEGLPGNNRLDLNKIAGIGFEFHRSSAQDSSIAEGTIFIDNIFLEGKTTITTGVNNDAVSPTNFRLEQNYPNPFNPTTTIEYSLPKQSQVKLDVFNTLGEQVRSLVDEEVPAGKHVVKFNASGLSSGVYLYRLQADGFVRSRKLILMK